MKIELNNSTILTDNCTSDLENKNKLKELKL